MWVGLLGEPRRLGRFMTLFAHKWSQAGFRYAAEGHILHRRLRAYMTQRRPACYF